MARLKGGRNRIEFFTITGDTFDTPAVYTNSQIMSMGVTRSGNAKQYALTQDEDTAAFQQFIDTYRATSDEATADTGKYQDGTDRPAISSGTTNPRLGYIYYGANNGTETKTEYGVCIVNQDSGGHTDSDDDSTNPTLTITTVAPDAETTAPIAAFNTSYVTAPVSAKTIPTAATDVRLAYGKTEFLTNNA